MFPLGTPLLPGAWLPLQVFELRYQMMLDDVLASSSMFGVVLIERGSEVGGGDVRSSCGTLAAVVRVDELPDGRRAVLARGTRRIRVVEWLADDPYPRASIEFWPEVVGSVPGETMAAIDQTIERLLSNALADPREARQQLAGRPDESPDDHLHRLASSFPLGPIDRQRVLAANSTPERGRFLLDALLDLEAAIDFGRS
jgi:uncharacterized protein